MKTKTISNLPNNRSLTIHNVVNECKVSTTCIAKGVDTFRNMDSMFHMIYSIKTGVRDKVK